MDSTTTTARETMIGSCLPWMDDSWQAPSRPSIVWVWAIEGVGLKDARKNTVVPSLIPPKIPPLWFVAFFGFP